MAKPLKIAVYVLPIVAFLGIVGLLEEGAPTESFLSEREWELVPSAAFPYAATSPSISLYSDLDVPVRELCSFADSSLQRLRQWLGAGVGFLRSGRYKIYLCKSLKLFEQFESGEPRTFQYRGGFYPDLDIIVLKWNADVDMRWDIAHELAHAVFKEVVGQECDAINEGLAEYAAARILGIEASHLQRSIAETLARDDVPSLPTLFSFGYWEFREDAVNRRNFAASWSLVKLLLESESEGIKGRFQTLLTRMRGIDAWLAFQNTYDVPLVENIWRERIEATTRWWPAFGQWDPEQNIGKVQDSGTVVAVHRDLLPAAPFAIRSRLKESLGDRGVIGFVFGFESPHYYMAAVLRVCESCVVFSRFNGDDWEDTSIQHIEPPLPDLTSHDLQLVCDSTGYVTVILGERILGSRSFGPAVFNGRVGLIAEPKPALVVDQEERAVEYEYAEVSLGERW